MNESKDLKYVGLFEITSWLLNWKVNKGKAILVTGRGGS
jgi:hypothetical protein